MNSQRQILSVRSQPKITQSLTAFPAIQPTPKKPVYYPIFIVTYARGSPSEPGGVKPYHWAFLIQAHKDSHRLHKGIVHQLRGAPGSFHYEGDETAFCLTNLGRAIDKVEVGSVDSSMLYRVAEILHRVSIVNNKDPRWNCQDWSTRGLEMLRLHEVVEDRQKQ